MAATAQNDRVNYLTLEQIGVDNIPKVVDTINKSSVVMKRVVSKPRPWRGRSVQQPVFYENSTLGTSFKGIETFDTSIDMHTAQMTWYPTGYAQPVGISVVERSINATPAGVIDLVKTSFEFAQNSMITNLGQIFYAFGSGNDFDGFGVIVDDGTSTSSYGGLTRTTYPTINAGGSTGLIAASGGVLDLATMASADDAATISGEAAETPNVIMANQTVWSLYESLLLPTTHASYTIPNITRTGGEGVQQNAGAGMGFHGGATALTFRGKDLMRDQKSTSGVMWFWNENWMTFNSLQLQGLDTVAIQEDATTGALDNYTQISAFQYRQPMMPVNQLAEIGIFVMYGNLICKNPNRNEAITSITTT